MTSEATSSTIGGEDDPAGVAKRRRYRKRLPRVGWRRSAASWKLQKLQRRSSRMSVAHCHRARRRAVQTADISSAVAQAAAAKTQVAAEQEAAKTATTAIVDLRRALSRRLPMPQASWPTSQLLQHKPWLRRQRLLMTKRLSQPNLLTSRMLRARGQGPGRP